MDNDPNVVREMGDQIFTVTLCLCSFYRSKLSEMVSQLNCIKVESF